MSRTYAAHEIYAFARTAGFSPDQSVTMTAIALAESGGSSVAHNEQGEDSQGLWQINVGSEGHAAAGWRSELDLWNPRDNAIAAFKVSDGGTKINPWTVTHGDRGSPYRDHMEAARGAAEYFGESADGQFEGPQNYGDSLHSAGDPSSPATEASSDVGTFIQLARSQKGDTYSWDAQTSSADVDPEEFDCAELVEWAAGRLGVEMADVSYGQYQQVRDAGSEIGVTEAVNTPGALLFRFGPDNDGDGLPDSRHVAISLGNGKTIEAASTALGVTELDAEGRGWTHGGLIPGFDYESGVTPDFAKLSETYVEMGDESEVGSPLDVQPVMSVQPMEEMAPVQENPDVPLVDSDADMLADDYEMKHGLDPNDPDSDGDGITDGYELIIIGSDYSLADSDFDGITDGVELEIGLDPTLFDNPEADGFVAPSELLSDSDGDGLVDYAEQIAGTDPLLADTDGDLIFDSDELDAGTDPLVADG